MGVTAVHKLEYPEQNDNVDVAGDMKKLADTTEAALEALNTSVLGRGVPTGTIVAFGGSTPPSGWHTCDGTAHGSPALQAVLGSTTTPDLRSRFIIGAGPSDPRNSTGGERQVTLSADQSGLRAHGHAAASGAESAGHTHSGTTDWMDRNNSHNHGGAVVAATPPIRVTHSRLGAETGAELAGTGVQYITDNTGLGNSASNYLAVSAVQDGHAHTINPSDINHQHNFTTGGISATHTHPVTVSDVAAMAAAQAHNNMPPFYALIYVIKT